MIYFSGAVYRLCMYSSFGGICLTPEMGNTPDLSFVRWIADNGCYTAGLRFSPVRWLSFLARWQGQGYCAFAVAPDVPFDMGATLIRSTPFLQCVRDMGYPVALAIQNGVEDFPLDWDSFDAVFIAGDKAFKTSRVAWDVIQAARKQDKWIHIARRNSLKAVQQAYDMGADSCDGTFLKYAPDANWVRMQRWFSHLSDYRQVTFDNVPSCVI